MFGNVSLLHTASLHQFCDGQMGLSQIDFQALAQIADVTGVEGVSFLVAMLTGLLGDIGLGFFYGKPISRGVALQALVVATIYVVALGYGAIRLRRSFSIGPRVLVIQPAQPPWNERSSTFAVNIEKLSRLTDEARKAAPADLIVWPENAVCTPFQLAEGELLLRTNYSGWLESIGCNTPIVIDGTAAGPDYQNQYQTCSVYIEGHLVGRYDKSCLVPWSEFIPFLRFLQGHAPGIATTYEDFVRREVPFVEQLKAGNPARTKPFLFHKDGQKFNFGTPVCFEVTHGPTVRKISIVSPERLDFLINPSNDSLLSPLVRRQVVAAMRYRAIEGRFYLIRASNSGFSCAAGPTGEIEEHLGALLSNGVEGWLLCQIALDPDRGKTVYLHWGDWPGAISVVVLAFMVLIGPASRVLAKLLRLKSSTTQTNGNSHEA